jgi:hypothetical protein
MKKPFLRKAQKMFNRLLLLFLILPAICFGQKRDFTGAAVYMPEKKNVLLQRAVQVFQEEVKLHSNVRIPFAGKTAIGKKLIWIGIEEKMAGLTVGSLTALKSLPPTGNEGFKIITPDRNTLIIAGHDERGVMFGVGYLLRKMDLSEGTVLLPEYLNISSTPAYPIRGHQLGYRPKTNAYDAWSVAQYDRYIRDLLIFGANSIEIMPPRTDDDPTSVHMKLPAIKMIAEQSRICKSYGMDVWMWYPNMGSDYNSPDSVKKELEERENVFRVLPKLDALFVPGGDPGELEPDDLFAWLGKVAAVLHKYHPQAKIWVSPQVFKPSKEWYKKFYDHVNRKYEWFGGIVYGPWIRTPLPEVRKLIGPDIKIRLYPDITHSISCQYPVPGWDLAYAMTLGRECINPRPADEKYIHNLYAPLASGSISYSEGTNDDVNKFIWTAQDWDPSTAVIETLRDYAHYFIGNGYDEGVAQGLMALENNFKGPLLANRQVEITFSQWQDMERSAPQEVLANPRFQSGLIRAYFDAYTQRRLIYENSLEREARTILEQAPAKGSFTAINEARKTLLLAHEKPVSQDLKLRCIALADSLFRSFGAQLTIEKHHAAGGRGNFIDNIDIPLNDAMWLLNQLSDIEKTGNEPGRLKAVETMLHRTDPGPGGFYDNFGDPSSWRRIVSKKSWADDPGSLESPRVSFGVGLTGVDWIHEVVAKGFEGQTTPLAWMDQINTLYDTPLEMEYDNLDPSSTYKLRIGYTGRFRSNMKLVADGVLIHDYMRMGTRPINEFTLPQEVTEDGKVRFTWSCGTDDGGEGERGSQVAELWLIRQTGKTDTDKHEIRNTISPPSVLLGGRKPVANWIWDSGEANPRNYYLMIRKTIDLDQEPENANAYISAFAFADVYINGKLIDRCPVNCDPEFQVYEKYDLKGYFKKGKNTISALVYNFGTGMHHRLNGRGGLFFQASLGIGKNKVIDINTDDTWRVLKADAWDSTTETRSSSSNLIGFVEKFDARIMPDIWKDSNFDDSKWEPAKMTGIPPVAPWNNITEVNRSPLFRENVFPVKHWISGDKVVYDFGKEISGTPVLELNSVKDGILLEMGTSERIQADSSALYKKRVNFTDYYIVKKGDQTWSPLTWRGFRYLSLSVNDTVKIKSISAVSRHFDLKREGSFECSDSLLNRIWEVGNQTLLLCAQDTYMDTPWREQTQYIAGDSRYLQNYAFYPFGMSSEFLIRYNILSGAWSQRWKDDGSIRSRYPTDWLLGEGSSAYLADYELEWILMLGEYYRYFGNEDLLRQVWPNLKKLVAHFDQYVSKEHGLLSKIPGWIVLDHPDTYPMEQLEEITGLNCLYYGALKQASFIAEKIMYDSIQAGIWKREADTVKANIQKWLWSSEQNLFTDSYGAKKCSQQTQVYALLYGIADEKQKPFLTEAIRAGDRSSEQSFSYYILRSVFDEKPQWALDFIRKYWGGQMKAPYFNGAWHEAWDIANWTTDLGSTSHAWCSGPTALLPQKVLGIETTGAGWQTFSVKPNFCDLKWAKGIIPSPYGSITVEWKREINGSVNLYIKVPENTTAEISLPGTDPGKIMINGKKAGINQSASVKDGKLAFKVSGGEYRIIAPF